MFCSSLLSRQFLRKKGLQRRMLPDSSCSSILLEGALSTYQYRNYSAVGLMGIEEDRNGSFQRGPSKAPKLIRSEYNCSSRNTTSESGMELGLLNATDGVIQDFGDIPLPARSDSHAPTTPTIKSMYDSIAPKIDLIVNDAGLAPLILGGDHSITYPVVKALSEIHVGEPITILHFDAHPDFYPDFDNNPASHASPFARIMEDGDINIRQVEQIGIRTMNREQSDYQKQFLDRIHITPAQIFMNGTMQASYNLIERLRKGDDDDHMNKRHLIYISIDMDVLDPAYAPGVSHRESGGLSVRELLNFLHTTLLTEVTKDNWRIIGADIVEYNVDRDVDFVTAAAAAKIMKEVAALIAHSWR